MPKLTIKTVGGSDAGSVDLDDAVFGIEPNGAVLHQVVTAQLAARRSGTQSTKTRAEVRGGGAKPWKQKGTGRARQGSIRSPQWRGGGVALGPKPRSYAQKTPKKMVRLAMWSALSDRAADGNVIVIDGWGFDEPKTKNAKAALSALGLEGRTLVVAERGDTNTWRSFANLAQVHVISPGELNAYDILVADTVVFTPDTLPSAPEPRAKNVPEDPGPASEAEIAGRKARKGRNKLRAGQIARAKVEAGESVGDDLKVKGPAKQTRAEKSLAKAAAGAAAAEAQSAEAKAEDAPAEAAPAEDGPVDEVADTSDSQEAPETNDGSAEGGDAAAPESNQGSGEGGESPEEQS